MYPGCCWLASDGSKDAMLMTLPSGIIDEAVVEMSAVVAMEAADWGSSMSGKSADGWELAKGEVKPVLPDAALAKGP